MDISVSPLFEKLLELQQLAFSLFQTHSVTVYQVMFLGKANILP